MWSNDQEKLSRNWGHILIKREVSQTKFVLLGKGETHMLIFNEKS